MAAVNVQKIHGKWASGRALDLHTLSSTYLGIDQYGYHQYDTVYSPLGGLLYRLKYQQDITAAQEIIVTAANWLKASVQKFDFIIPVPPSTPRAVQPVLVLANGIGAAVGLPVVSCVSTTRTTSQLKAISDPEQRRVALAGLHAVDASMTKGKRILVLDDLYRSGSTLNAITDVLQNRGAAARVSVLTITRTRNNR